MCENGVIRKEVLELLKAWGEWSKANIEELVNEAILKVLKNVAEEVGSYGVPKAWEFAERAEELLKMYTRN